MPVARKTDEAPDWSRFSAFGVFQCEDAEKFDDHFHDAHEYWLIFQGRAIVQSEGKEYEVGPGDVVFTRMGDYHKVVKVAEAPLRGFYVEDELQGKKRRGHLHKEDE